LGGEGAGGREGADASSDYILFTKWRTQTSHLKGDRYRPSRMVTCTMGSKTRGGGKEDEDPSRAEAVQILTLSHHAKVSDFQLDVKGK